MKPYPTTPQRVVDAIHVVAAYLRDIEAAEAMISPSGGASFHPERKSDQLLAAWEEEREMLLKEIETAVAWIEEDDNPYKPTKAEILPQLRAAIVKATAPAAEELTG